MRTIIFTVKQVEELTECIYVRYDFEGDFILLLDLGNRPFYSMEIAYEYLSKHVKGCYWEISTYKQALIGNGMRSN
jgi:hypothetical protein